MVVCGGGGLNKYQRRAADAFQPPLLRRSGFRQQVKTGVRLLQLHCMHDLKNMT